MAAERDLELLDDYLSNRLDAQGKAEFESKLTQDPGLKSELELQQQFVDGIKKARMAELKSMLNNVPVPPAATGTAAGAKIAVAVVAAALVGTSLYFYFDKDQKQENRPSTEVKSENNPAIDKEQPSENNASKTDDEEPVVSEEPAASENKAIAVPKASRKATTKSGKPTIDVYDPTKESPEKDKSSDGSNLVKQPLDGTVVEINSSNKKRFQYQFSNGKLVLYGPFEKNLYEVLEFFDDQKRSVFLFYQDKYYHLKDGSDGVQSLVAIKDQALLKKLKESRNK
jgi:hypothetical protein